MKPSPGISEGTGRRKRVKSNSSLKEQHGCRPRAERLRNDNHYGQRGHCASLRTWTDWAQARSSHKEDVLECWGFFSCEVKGRHWRFFVLSGRNVWEAREKQEQMVTFILKNQLGLAALLEKVTVCHKLSKEENTVLSWKENHLKKFQGYLMQLGQLTTVMRKFKLDECKLVSLKFSCFRRPKIMSLWGQCLCLSCFYYILTTYSKSSMH